MLVELCKGAGALGSNDLNDEGGGMAELLLFSMSLAIPNASCKDFNLNRYSSSCMSSHSPENNQLRRLLGLSPMMRIDKHSNLFK